jgi:predicted acyl esterase
MSALTDFLYPFFLYGYQQAQSFFKITFYAAIGSRLLYCFCFILVWHLIWKRQMPNFYQKKKNFWLSFFLSQLGYFCLSIVNNYGSILILSYTVCVCASLLKQKPIRGYNNVLRWFGILLSPLFTIGVFIYGWYDFFNNQRLIKEFIAILVGLFLFGIKTTLYPYGKSIFWYNYKQSSNLWVNIPQKSKIAFLLIVFLIPLSFIGIIMSKFQVVNYRDYAIPMRDGIHLFGRCFFPPGYEEGDKYSVILERTPYSAISVSLSGDTSKYNIDNRYITLYIDMRGRYNSEGIFDAFQSESKDGVDGISWIKDQSWCNGNIGSFGGSANAINQYLWQSEGPLGMKAATMDVGGGEAYKYIFYNGGCVHKNLCESWLWAVNASACYQTFLNHPTESSFWENMSLWMNNRYKNVNVRAVHTGGWFDPFAQATIDGYLAYNQGSSYAQNHQILIMGPWGHGSGTSALNHIDIKFPDNGAGNSLITQMKQRIFDEGLKNIPIDWETQPRVYYYVMGDPYAIGSQIDFNIWRAVNEWPVKSSPQAWYFHPNGTLSVDVPESYTELSYLYDPRDPVLTIGGRNLVTTYNGQLAVGARDQRIVEFNRNDILHFNSSILTTPVEIVGRINATLFIKSNCTDTDFTAKLMDVFPDGRMIYVADGIIKTRYHNGFTQENYLQPGILYELNIDLWSTAYRFVSGHQICLAISSSNYDAYAINPNTGSPIIDSVNATNGGSVDWNHIPYNIANNTLVCVPNIHSSCIWFPRTL